MKYDEPVYVVDIFREVVNKVSVNLTSQLQTVYPQITGVHYLVGHHTEIKERLKRKTYDKYPLIALFQDFLMHRGEGSGYYGSVSLQFMIVYHTSKTDYTEDRYDKVFKPIIFPIYFEFLRQIAKHKNLVVKSDSEIDHWPIERPHWGNPKIYGNDGYILDDVLDGIEMRDTKMFIKQNC